MPGTSAVTCRSSVRPGPSGRVRRPEQSELHVTHAHPLRIGEGCGEEKADAPSAPSAHSGLRWSTVFAASTITAGRKDDPVRDDVVLDVRARDGRRA